ncbi:hypothetical protein D3C85_1420720 [compost metagenome]
MLHVDSTPRISEATERLQHLLVFFQDVVELDGPDVTGVIQHTANVDHLLARVNSWDDNFLDQSLALVQDNRQSPCTTDVRPFDFLEQCLTTLCLRHEVFNDQNVPIEVHVELCLDIARGILSITQTCAVN